MAASAYTSPASTSPKDMGKLKDLGNIGGLAPLAMIKPDISLNLVCEPISMAALEAQQEHWQWLADNAVDDNPFLSPAFMIPLSMQTDLESQMSFVAIWRESGGAELAASRRLVGLVPLAAKRLKFARSILGRGEVSLWKHSAQPFALPLLAGPVAEAEMALEAFTSWLSQRWPRIRRLTSPAVDAGSHFCEMLAAQSMNRQWPLQRGAACSSTRGLDFRPSEAPASAASVQVLATKADIRAGIEQMLAFDAVNNQRQSSGNSSGDAILLDPQKSGFMRAALRSFATQQKVILCMLEGAAGTAVILGRKRGYLWWIAGPEDRNPTVEAALAAAAERHLGTPIVAACQHQLAGLWASPIHTEDWLLTLDADRNPISA